ncbi:LAFA_0B06194g1_1 [Lachancea sp. 'fantastica']|nr:LAFA_0B06194g1_1 [Lachancea sp. 'fantastica']
MTSVPQRHTYYGAPSSVYTQSRHLSAFESSTKRKHVTFGPYIVGSTLGEGEFGKVKMGWSKHPASSLDVPKQVAIKLVRRDTIPKNSEKEVKIYREINALKHLTHPNIVKLEEVLQNSKYIGIVLEYASGGEFYKYIQRKRRLKESVACRLFAQLISGVCYMHSKGLVHRDLKLENLLLDKQENLLITDFGFVNEFSPEDELMKTSCGSPCYAAPELVVTTWPYQARKADIWSCGVILYAMLAGYLPWDDDSENPDGDDIGKLYRYITKTPLKFPDYISPVPRDLLRETLQSDPKRRYGTTQILQHRWLRPHQAFLSVLPAEWDQVSKNQDVLRRPPSKRDGANASRPRSNCSVSSSNSKNEKRNSLIMDSTLYSQPVPPQQSQSHAVATPSSPSPRMRQSPVKINRHSRSNSAASVALQAVVDAEKEYHATHTNPPSSASLSALQLENSPSSGQNTSPRLHSHAPKKQSHATVSSLKDSIIVETSPLKGSSAHVLSPLQIDPNTGLILSPKSEGPTIPLTHTTHKTSHTTVNKTHNLPAHRRPRPTSYNPTSYTAFNDTSYAIPGFTVPEKNSNEKGSIENLLSMDKTSQHTLQKDSQRLSQTFLDMQIVAGDLIKTGDNGATAAKKIHDQVEYADHRMDLMRQRRQSQRYSAVYDKLFGAVPEQSEVLTDEEPINSEPSTPIVQELKVSQEPIKGNKKRFSILSGYSSYNTSKTSIESEHGKDKTKITANNEAELEGRSTKASSRSSSATHNVKDKRDEKREISNTDKTKAAEEVSKDSSLSQKTESRADQMESREQQSATPQTVKRSSSLRKTSKNSTRPNRGSVMISSISRLGSSTDSGSNRTGNNEARPREQSTAKKVIDFFKRRSMRL